MFSIACALFHFPYPVTSLFATLTRTAGVCTNNSQSGTRYSPISTRLAAAQGPARVGGPARLSRSPARRGGQLSRSVFIYPLFFLPLAHSFALSCTLRKLNPFIFSRFRTLCEKYPGWGERVVLVFLTKGFSIRASLSAPRCDPRLPAAASRQVRRLLLVGGQVPAYTQSEFAKSVGSHT